MIACKKLLTALIATDHLWANKMIWDSTLTLGVEDN